jgi:uncharacterized membrane protein
MEEVIYFSHLGVSVSHTDFIINGQYITIQSVNTVRYKRLKPKLGMARICLFGGLALAFGSGALPLLGLFAMLFGGVFWFLTVPVYVVVVHTKVGEVQALISESFSDIENVLTVLNVAITQRVTFT